MNISKQLTTKTNMKDYGTSTSVPTFTYDLHVSFIEARPAQPDFARPRFQMSAVEVAIPIQTVPTAAQRARALWHTAQDEFHRLNWESDGSGLQIGVCIGRATCNVPICP